MDKYLAKDELQDAWRRFQFFFTLIRNQTVTHGLSTKTNPDFCKNDFLTDHSTIQVQHMIRVVHKKKFLI